MCINNSYKQSNIQMYKVTMMRVNIFLSQTLLKWSYHLTHCSDILYYCSQFVYKDVFVILQICC